MIKGISHITLIVKDIDKASAFFENIFDAKIIYDSEDKQFSLSRERFLLVGDLWIAIMQGESLSEKTYNHIAFQISESDFFKYEQRLQNLSVQIKAPRNRVDGEGRSLYFYDYDNHLFELHTGILAERLSTYERESKR